MIQATHNGVVYKLYAVQEFTNVAIALTADGTRKWSKSFIMTEITKPKIEAQGGYVKWLKQFIAAINDVLKTLTTNPSAEPTTIEGLINKALADGFIMQAMPEGLQVVEKP